ncbi:DUF1549 domain-containing protein [Neorhodopirellula lusitana]|uniref:DUF1549 domain-containing protein n=1 Tax=Neorhodopirellula lusitana TaxID=445327 RepID=UPI00384D6187
MIDKPDDSSRLRGSPNLASLGSRVGRWALLVFLMLSTFAVLVTGMSDNQPTPTHPQSPAHPPKISADTSHWNSQIERAWQEQVRAAGLTPAPTADWLTVCRRLSLALVGTGMSLEEIRRLEHYPEEQRANVHRETLLNDGRFHDYWGERFTRFLVGADQGPFLVYRRRRFRTWLSEQIAAGSPYDHLTRQLIAAEGLWTDRPEVNFHTVTFDTGEGKPDPVRIAARVSRAFLGIRIDCLQCHDDFLGNVSMGDPTWMRKDVIPKDVKQKDETLRNNETPSADSNAAPTTDYREGTQQDFHSLAAFFTAAKNKGLQGLQSKPADYSFQYLYAESETQVPPQVPFRPDLCPSEEERPNARMRLAHWITSPENLQFSRATVTRVWTLLFGRPPGDAVDDLSLDDTPSPLMMTLTRAFIDDGFDLKSLIRMITNSPAFHVDSRADFEITQRHEDAMAAFPLVRLRAEQVAGAIIQAGRVKTIDRESSFIVQLQRYGETNDFLKRYGDLGDDEFSSDAITIPQRLLMLNGKLTREITQWNPILNTSAHAGMFAPNPTGVVESLYLATLNRLPTLTEQEHFTQRIEDAESRKSAIEDIVWVLFNSSEFAWNH